MTEGELLGDVNGNGHPHRVVAHHMAGELVVAGLGEGPGDRSFRRHPLARSRLRRHRLPAAHHVAGLLDHEFMLVLTGVGDIEGVLDADLELGLARP